MAGYDIRSETTTTVVPALERKAGADDGDVAGPYRLLADGAQCDRYRIVRLIGKGGMSEVYEALHQDLRKRVALKVMSPELLDNREAHARFAAEAINAASLSHPNVIEVVDMGSVRGLPYLVMNLLEGRDLGMLYQQHGPLQAAELLDLVLPVAMAVAAGHDRGIMHRDLKPENIFLHNESGRIVPKLLDFGVSRMLGARRITVNSHVFGTPQYMAPEQARGEKINDPRTDQYALGVILYEGLTGRLPMTAQHPYVLLHSVAFGSFLPPSVHVPVARGLERVILRAMARDPNQRFASMRELASALLPFAGPAGRGALSGLGLPAAAAAPMEFPALTADGPPVLSVSMLLSMLVRRPGVLLAAVVVTAALAFVSLWGTAQCAFALYEAWR
jgi:serine/threonine-protein kinase